MLFGITKTRRSELTLPSRAGYCAPRLDRRVFEIENFGLKAGVLNPKFSMNDPIGAEPRGIYCQN